jgi:hypothetical protein
MRGGDAEADWDTRGGNKLKIWHQSLEAARWPAGRRQEAARRGGEGGDFYGMGGVVSRSGRRCLRRWVAADVVGESGKGAVGT